MYFLLKMGIFQPATLVYQRVTLPERNFFLRSLNVDFANVKCSTSNVFCAAWKEGICLCHLPRLVILDDSGAK